jgi:lipoprotein
MKKLLFLALVAGATLVGCRKDSDQPALDFKFSVEAVNHNFSDKGVNESVTIPFKLDADYDFEKQPIRYRVEADKQSSLSVGGQNISAGEAYTLSEPKLDLIYKGKEKGEHNIKVTFFNSDNRQITKEVKLNFKEFGYTLEVLNGKLNAYQGENVDFNLKITPKNGAPQMDYFIIFKSYDAQDPNLQKTVLTINGERIIFDKEYRIENLLDTKIRINSFYTGSKQLKYIIKNQTFEREESIQLNVSQVTMRAELNFDKVETNNTEGTLKLQGYVAKNIKYNGKLWYKTWISEGDPTGIENTNNEYREYTLPDNNEFSINVRTTKKGVYVYFIQFKDEFGNESSTSQFTLTINDKTFSIEQITPDLSNIYQGQDVSLIFSLRGNYESARYKIKFISFDEQDIDLVKSSIKYNGTNIRMNELKDTQRNNENNTIIVNSFNFGEKRLVYEVYEVTNEENKVRKETIINFKKAPISSDIRVVDNYVYQNVDFTLKGKVNHMSRTKQIQYRTKAFLDDEVAYIVGERNEIPTTNNNWTNTTLDENNNFTLTIKPTHRERFAYIIQFKDEFGNESNPQEIMIDVQEPIIVNELYFMPNTGGIYTLIQLKSDFKFVDPNIRISHITARFPNSETYIYRDNRGVSHSLRINFQPDWNDWDVGNLNEYKTIDAIRRAQIILNFSINETDKNKRKSIRTELLRMVQQRYKGYIEIQTNNGTYTRAVPFRQMESLNYDER